MSNLLLRDELLQALRQLKPGLSSKEIIEQGVCFNFHGDSIVTYNDFISVSIPFESGLHGSVKADDLFRLLDKIDAKHISLSMEGNEILISAGKAKAGLSLSEKILPSVMVESEFLEISKDFIAGLRFCYFSAGQDMTRPHLTCVHVQGNKISSSDNLRITQVVLESAAPVDFMLSAKAVDFFSGYNFTHVAKDMAWIHFAEEDSGLILSVRLMAGELIQVDQFFEIEGPIIEFPAGLAEVIERSKIMTEGDSVMDLQIRLTLSDGKLVCKGQKATGWVEEEVDLDYSGKPISLSINPLFLLDILAKTNKMMIGESLCMFWGENFRHAMMPVMG